MHLVLSMSRLQRLNAGLRLIDCIAFTCMLGHCLVFEFWINEVNAQYSKQQSVTFMKIVPRTNIRIYLYQKITWTNIWIYSYKKFDTNECPNRYSYWRAIYIDSQPPFAHILQGASFDQMLSLWSRVYQKILFLGPIFPYTPPRW